MSAEREPITRLSAKTPRRGAGEEPLINGSGEAASLFAFAQHEQLANELSQRLVRCCSVEDATLEGAVCCR